MTYTSQIVTIRGKDYKVMGISAASMDKKFWGKRKYTLVSIETGELFFAFGKRITHNMAVTKRNG